MPQPPFDSVLLIGYGAPSRVEDVRTFLRVVLGPRAARPERIEEVARHYEHIGGSPLNALTFRQAEALESSLAAAGRPLPVYVGMRNWHPFLAYTLWSMGLEGRRRAVGVILSPYRCDASWDRYQREVTQARNDLRALFGPQAVVPEVEFIEPYYAAPGFITAQADRVRETLVRATAPPTHSPTRSLAHSLLFTAHSIPVEMAEQSPYVAQLTEASRRVAESLGCQRWRLCWQSRSGCPEQPWLEPDVSDVLREIAAEGRARSDQWHRRPAGASAPSTPPCVILVPIGFLCDHVEVLYDLDVEAAQTAREVGIEMLRAGTVGDHPAFIQAWTELVVDALRSRGSASAGTQAGRQWD